MELKVSKHARQRLTERLGDPAIEPRLMDKLREASAAGASGVISGRWLYVIKNEVLVTVRPKPQGRRPSMEPAVRRGGECRGTSLIPRPRNEYCNRGFRPRRLSDPSRLRTLRKEARGDHERPPPKIPHGF